jgi:hypothetical protein
MKTELQTILESCRYRTREYTGRGMYDSCLAVDGWTDMSGNTSSLNQSDVGELASAILMNTSCENQKELARKVSNMRTDSMGKGIIIYFPTAKFYQGY